MSTQSPPATPGFVGWLAANRGTGGIAIVVLGIAVLALPVTLVSKYEWAFLPVVVTTGLLGLLCISVGVSIRFLAPETGDVDRLRMLVLLLGGAGGLLIAATGVCLAYLWWNVLPDWLREDKREELWKMLVALMTLLAGLAVMFIGLQAARAEERTNPALRRLVFGYNAVLGGLLLLILLAVVNAYVSARYATAIEAIDRGDTSLSERAVNVAKGLTQPVRFYVVWPTDDELIFPLRTLLGNVEDVSPQVRVTYLSPTLDQEAVRDLKRKYPNKIGQEAVGVLVVKGEEKPENATFLRDSDLYGREGGGRFGAESQLKFKGEDRIVAALMSGRTVVYFTQGAGEPDLNDSNPRSPEGLGVLRERLGGRGNTEVKDLKINPADPKVPDDATVVVVVNPQPPVGAALVKALRTYLVEKHGKAVVMLDVPPPSGGDKTMPATGLEGLLGEFGVEVTNERIYMAEPIPTNRGVIDQRDILLLALAAEQRQSGSELARAFGGKPVLTAGVRVVRPARGAANPMLRAEPLLTTLPQFGAWTETDLTVDPNQTLAAFEKDPNLARKRVSAAPIPAAVVVTESAPPMHPPTEAPPAPKPTLIVFGDGTMVGNAFAGEGIASSNFAFFASTLDWLAERPTSVGVGSRSLKFYTMEPTVSGVSLIVLPGLIALVGIAGLGLGVWVVRRR